MSCASCIYQFVSIIVSLAIVIVTYFKWCHKYWARKGVPYMEPSIPFGNSENPFAQKKSSNERLQSKYEHFKSLGHRHGGTYITTTPIYIPIDPDLIKNIMTRDFQHFTDHGVYFDEKHEPLSAHLFSLEGQQWKNLRSKLTPTFTSGKLKTMFQMIIDCGAAMTTHVEKHVAESLDIKDVSMSYTVDVIGSCAFGLDCDSFNDPNAEFMKHARQIFSGGFARKLRMFCTSMFPSLSKRIGVRIFRKEISVFFFDLVQRMVKHREENREQRNDFMQLLMALRNEEEKGGVGGLTIEQIAAQAFVFFLAGFETTSTLMTFCLYELAMHQDVQDKARREIEDLLDDNDGKFTYDGLMKLKYLGQIIDETLRMYPPVPVILRKCVKDYKIPETDVTLDEGTRVFISTRGLHYDPEFYPNPKQFDPERFGEGNKSKIHPFVFLPFGEGPRICIGLRFGQMQARVGIATILKNFRVKISPQTVLPIEISPNSFLLATKDKIWLDFEKIQ